MNETPTLDRRYWRERAAAVLPGATARQIVRAAQILRLQYDAPTAVYDANGSSLPTWEYGFAPLKPSDEATDTRDLKPRTIRAPYLTLTPRGYVSGLAVDATAYAGRVGGGVPGVPNLSVAPDTWDGVKSTIGRDVMGPIVRHGGTARVQGDCVPRSIDDLPNGATPGLLATMLRDLPRNPIGARGWQVSVLTDLFYGDDPELPAQGGYDTLQSGEHVPAGVDLSAVRGVVGKQAAAMPDKRMSWPMRTRLPRVRIRNSERDLLTPGALAAPHTDRDLLWAGHKLVKRGKLAHANRGGKRARRTILAGAGIVVEQPAAVATLAENLNRGERVEATYAGVRLTITRASGGTWSITAPTGKANGLRTPANVAKRASALVA